MSISDICISDFNSFCKALVNYKPDELDIKQSIIEDLVNGDHARQQAFIELNFYPKNMIINHDFNFDTTLNRGLKLNSLKSVKYLLNYLFEHRCIQNYY